ncbi:MAG: hypothetical protein R6V54_00985 [Desulfobacteraceae bacterium]
MANKKQWGQACDFVVLEKNIPVETHVAFSKSLKLTISIVFSFMVIFLG